MVWNWGFCLCPSVGFEARVEVGEKDGAFQWRWGWEQPQSPDSEEKGRCGVAVEGRKARKPEKAVGADMLSLARKQDAFQRTQDARGVGVLAIWRFVPHSSFSLLSLFPAPPFPFPYPYLTLPTFVRFLGPPLLPALPLSIPPFPTSP